MKEKLKDRYVILGICFVIFGLVIILKLVNLQIVEGEKYNADSQRKVLKEGPVIAPRGKILDRYGVPVAVNRQGFTVQIVKTAIKTDELNEMLLKLAGILDKNNDSYYDSISKYLTFNPITFNGKAWSEIKSWEMNKDRLGITNEQDLQQNPAGLFKYLRDTKFKIDPKYTDEEAYKIMKLRYEILLNNWNYSTGGSIFLAEDVSQMTIAEIEERHDEFPGVITDVEPVRQYIDAFNEAHIIGYVRSIDAKQFEELKDEGYQNDDIIGQDGVEKAAERYLKGKDGKKSIEVDTNGRLTQQQESVPAIPGSDVVLTIDTSLQRVAMESLKRNIQAIRVKGDKNNMGDANAGAVVALDVNSGEVLAMASYPSYDPGIFLKGSDDKTAQQAIMDLFSKDNPDKPAINRAISGTYAPGSTFKPLTAIAALEEGVITPSTVIVDTGKVTLGGWEFKCLEFPAWGHGSLILKKALETSCNIYFHEIGFNTGIDNIDKWAEFFGLGQKTGIDLPNEKQGIMSSKDMKEKLRNDAWRPADTAQVSIGQFDNSFTPLQLANYISTLANGGKKYKPFIIKKVIKYDSSTVMETQPTFEKVPVKPETISAIKEGMVAVTQSIDGTASQYFKGLPFEVAGKTGTAQTGKEATHSSNALFVCYAPADNPKIAIAVVVERGAWGSNTAPIARDIIDQYFGLNSTNNADVSLKPDEPVFTP